MPGHDIIVIGASAGGVGALVTLTGLLPRKLEAAVFIVLHIPAHSPSMLPDILNRSGRLKAESATDNTDIEYGHIYLAPPDFHLLVERGHIRVIHGPTENRHRPASTRSSALLHRRTGRVPLASSSLARSTMGPPGCRQSNNAAASPLCKTHRMLSFPVCRRVR